MELETGAVCRVEDAHSTVIPDISNYCVCSHITGVEVNCTHVSKPTASTWWRSMQKELHLRLWKMLTKRTKTNDRGRQLSYSSSYKYGEWQRRWLFISSCLYVGFIMCRKSFHSGIALRQVHACGDGLWHQHGEGVGDTVDQIVSLQINRVDVTWHCLSQRRSTVKVDWSYIITPVVCAPAPSMEVRYFSIIGTKYGIRSTVKRTSNAVLLYCLLCFSTDIRDVNRISACCNAPRTYMQHMEPR